MSKRKFQDDDDEPMLRIRLADEAGEQLLAQQCLLRTFSRLCRRLPSDSDVWELSALLIDGQPVPRETAIAWLNKAYAAANGEGEFRKQEPDLSKTFTGLCQLLAFADAVESTKALLNTCVAQLDGLQLHAQLGKQRLQLETDGRPYHTHTEEPLQLRTNLWTKLSKTIHKVGSPAANEAEVAAFRVQAAAQTEQLLFMAIKLQLAPLIERLHAFVAACMSFTTGALRPNPQGVFSERVLDAAVGANWLARQAWADSIKQQRCACTDVNQPGWCQLLEPLDLTEKQRAPLKIKAKLTRDFMGAAKGTVVEVKVDLLNYGMITLGGNMFPAQLLLGYGASLEL